MSGQLLMRTKKTQKSFQNFILHYDKPMLITKSTTTESIIQFHEASGKDKTCLRGKFVGISSLNSDLDIAVFHSV